MWGRFVEKIDESFGGDDSDAIICQRSTESDIDDGNGWNDADAFDDDAFDDDVFDDDVFDDDAFDDDAFDDDAFDEEVADKQALDDEALENEVLDDDPLGNEILEDELRQDGSTDDEQSYNESLNDESNDGPLNEEPLNEEPLNEEALNEEPLNEEPLNEEPLNEEPLNDEGAADEIIGNDAIGEETPGNGTECKSVADLNPGRNFNDQENGIACHSMKHNDIGRQHYGHDMNRDAHSIRDTDTYVPSATTADGPDAGENPTTSTVKEEGIESLARLTLSSRHLPSSPETMLQDVQTLEMRHETSYHAEAAIPQSKLQMAPKHPIALISTVSSQAPPESLPSCITVSAPGKALIAGGYLVLERPNPGVVLGAKGCRFYSTVTFRSPHMINGTFESESVSESREAGNASKCILLDVHSPQFHRVLSYKLTYSLTSSSTENILSESKEGIGCLDAITIQPREASSYCPNKFVEQSLLLVFAYIRKSLGAEKFHSHLKRRETAVNGETALAIKLRADNDFYSQITHLKQREWDLTPQNVSQLEPFMPCPRDQSNGKALVNKTGMGSSAALVTSLVGSLLRFFGLISLPCTIDEDEDSAIENPVRQKNIDKIKEGLRITHNLSQICHCHAQGKVGSGFDVSSAIFGSQIYVRFSNHIIETYLEEVKKSNEIYADDSDIFFSLTEPLSRRLLDLVNDTEKKWDSMVTPINLPAGIELLMADVHGGSDSPSMAKKILDWKRNNRKVGFLDDYYWKDLKRCNKKIASLLCNQFSSQVIIDGLRRDGAMILANRNAEQWKKPMPSSWHEYEGSSWDVAAKLLDLRMALLESRQNLKGMGKAAGVPVEPDEQTALANATMKLPGVIAAGVPGAGGHDALYAIYVKGPETYDGRSDRVRDKIGNLWSEFNSKEKGYKICPLSARVAGFGGDNGLCEENLGW